MRRLLLLPLLLLMAILVGNTSRYTAQNTSGDATWDHTVPSGSNRILIVALGSGSVTAGSQTVDYGGQALTRLDTAVRDSAGIDNETQWWYLIDPPEGTATITITNFGDDDRAAVGIDLTGVHQSTPFGTSVTGGGGTSVLITVPAESGDLVLDMVTASEARFPVEGSGQTIQARAPLEANLQGHLHDPQVVVSTKPGASPSVDMSWTERDGNGASFAQIGAAIKPASGGGGQTLSLVPVEASWQAVPATASPGPVSRSAAPAEATWESVPLTPAPGPVARSLQPAVGSWAALAATVSPGEVTRSLAPAEASWGAVPVSVAVGAISRALQAAEATWEALALGVQTGGVQTVTAVPAEASWEVVAPTVQVGPVAVAASPAVATWQVLELLVQTGVQSVLAAPAEASWGVRPLSVQLGAATLELVAAEADWRAVTLQTSAGPLTVAAVPAEGQWAAVALTVVHGLLEPGPARSSGSTPLVLKSSKSTALQIVDRATTILKLISRGETRWPT